MNNLSYKPEYHRCLPHLQPPGATFFVTFRLANSIPQTVIRRWHEERNALTQTLQCMPDDEAQHISLQFTRKRFIELEQLLDGATAGERWLQDERLAQIVCRFMRNKDSVQYRLDAYCVMSNHVHVLLMPLPTDETASSYYPLQKILHSFKRLSAIECNKLRQRAGALWEEESFDHYCRDHEEWIRVLHYILNNPVKAGMVSHWRDYPFTYCSEMALQFVTV